MIRLISAKSLTPDDRLMPDGDIVTAVHDRGDQIYLKVRPAGKKRAIGWLVHRDHLFSVEIEGATP